MLKLFQALVDVAGAVRGQTADDLGLHIHVFSPKAQKRYVCKSFMHRKEVNYK